MRNLTELFNLLCVCLFMNNLFSQSDFTIRFYEHVNFSTQ